MSVRYSRDVMGTVHDVRLMHGSHALATVSLRIVERVTRNAFRSIPSDELDRLNNAVDDLRRVLVKCSRRRHTHAYLVLDARVFTLSILSDEDGVDVLIRSLEALNGNARPDVGEEVEGPTKRQVQ